MRTKKTIALLLILFSFLLNAQKSSEVSLLFIGDIMGHGSQIKAAYDEKTNAYDYNSVFEKVAPIIKKADFAIGNLEVTLAGPPYTGYPQFSSPDNLAVTCKSSGIDVLVTANNHSCDRRKKGVLRTIQILDSLNIKHTGTFKNEVDRRDNNLLLLQKNQIKIGLLNYTYGTNGIPATPPTIVNLINFETMLNDIKKAKQQDLDQLIVFLHWGKEYQSHPSDEQQKVAQFLFKNGVDIIIGSHPHVLQRMEVFTNVEQKDQAIVYSLGNFVSNQRTRKRDGGAMFELKLEKSNHKTRIKESGYHLTWVHKPLINGRRTFQILPCAETVLNDYEGLDSISKSKMQVFIEDAKALLDSENIGVEEIPAFY